MKSGLDVYGFNCIIDDDKKSLEKKEHWFGRAINGSALVRNSSKFSLKLIDPIAGMELKMVSVV